MAETVELTREGVRPGIRFDNTGGGASTFETALQDLRAKQIKPESMDMDEEDAMEPDAPVDENESRLPEWLSGMEPLNWSIEACKKTSPQGRNCCLFYPLGYCKSFDVVNGFCMFHLRAVFNLIYLTDHSYQLNDRGKPVVLERSRTFVGEPQPIDDKVTAVFPIFELFATRPPVTKIKMHHLANFLRSTNMANWERVYTLHVNFLYSLVTLRCKSSGYDRQDRLLDSQLLLHWNLWNESQSWLLARYPAKLRVYYTSNGVNVETADVSGFTAITQMVVRLFSVPYTSLNTERFFSTVSSYGIHVRRHLSFVNSLCSVGSTFCSNGVTTLGNVATFTYVRTDDNKYSLLRYAAERSCDENFSVRAKVNLDAPKLNTLVTTKIKTDIE